MQGVISRKYAIAALLIAVFLVVAYTVPQFYKLFSELYVKRSAEAAVTFVDPQSPTYDNMVTIAGRKDRSAQVLVNSHQLALLDNQTDFTFFASLGLGRNSFIIEYINQDGEVTLQESIQVNRHGLGDINLSGDVDVFDLGQLAIYLESASDYFVLADLKPDSVINVFDLGIFTGVFEQAAYTYDVHTPIGQTNVPPTPTASPLPSPVPSPTGVNQGGPTPTHIAGGIWFISPHGSDENNGKSLSRPFKTIQHALSLALPGDIIRLADGEYRQDVRTVRNGTVENPISIVGSPDAVLKGGGDGRIVEVKHDFHIFNGFTIDGLHGDPNRIEGYRDKLVYAVGDDFLEGVEGLRLLFMHFKNAGGECVRIRYFSHHNEVAYSQFHRCGVYDYMFNDGGKNGEGVYIGTAPSQLASDFSSGKVPSSDQDESHHNYVHHNYFDTQGNECVDIKEYSRFNLVTDNICVSQFDVESAAFDARGACNAFAFNQVGQNSQSTDIHGSAFRLGGHELGQARHNDVYKNFVLTYDQSTNFAIDVPRDDLQGLICGNVDGNNNPGFSGSLTNGSHVTNPISCQNTDFAAGIRGCVGPGCPYHAEHVLQNLPLPQSAECIP